MTVAGPDGMAVDDAGNLFVASYDGRSRSSLPTASLGRHPRAADPLQLRLRRRRRPHLVHHGGKGLYRVRLAIPVPTNS